MIKQISANFLSPLAGFKYVQNPGIIKGLFPKSELEGGGA